MTILVDEARWPWRGTTWCHLVSDASLGELHEFAAALGCRRVGFQGDHYDIDVETRLHALALGAEPCSSRELVRAMRRANLRIRPSQFEKWQLLDEGAAVASEVQRVLQPVCSDSEIAARKSDRWFVLQRGQGARAYVMGGDVPTDSAASWLPSSDPSIGLFVRLDLRNRWSIERIVPPPQDHE